MNIVIISSFFFPVIQPRSFRATELSKEFARRGHRVSVITMNTVDDFDYDSYEKEHGIEICRETIIRQDGTAVAAANSRKMRRVEKWARAAVGYLFCGRMIQYAHLMYKALLRQNCLDEADMVIALSTPFCIHWALSKYVKKKGKYFVTIADSGDPFYYSKQWKLAPWFKYIERNVYKQMDYLTIPTANAIPSYDTLIPKEKIRVIPQGFDMSHLNLYQGGFGETVHIAYAGVFYWGIRNPEFLFDYLDKCSKDYVFHLYLRYRDAVLDQTINKYPNLRSRLRVEYNVPHDKLLYKLSKMHFLINIENLSNTQIPSKLIDYGMTGRPILSCNETNFSSDVMEQFLSGDYHQRYSINLDDYNIINVADQFMALNG